MLRVIKNRLRAIAPSTVFLLLTWYFLWNTWHGARGLDAQRAEQTELDAATARFKAIDAQRRELETRIADLNGQSIAVDMLDNQARLVNGLANPADLVISLPAPQAKK